MSNSCYSSELLSLGLPLLGIVGLAPDVPEDKDDGGSGITEEQAALRTFKKRLSTTMYANRNKDGGDDLQLLSYANQPYYRIVPFQVIVFL
jgi:hypothetical protein